MEVFKFKLKIEIIPISKVIEQVIFCPVSEMASTLESNRITVIKKIKEILKQYINDNLDNSIDVWEWADVINISSENKPIAKCFILEDFTEENRRIADALYKYIPYGKSPSEYNKQTEFEIFKERFLFWKEKLGLKNWEILYFVEKNSKENNTPYATINYILEQRQAWVYFYGRGANTDINIDTQALHEALHLLVADCETDALVKHSIINTVMACFKDKTIFEALQGSNDK